jgi:hypothetical protein
MLSFDELEGDTICSSKNKTPIPFSEEEWGFSFV